MKITKLYLKNWLSHRETTVEMDRLVVFRGSNAAGKSSMEKAISLLLTGRADGTDDRGSGAKELIRKGEDKSLVGAQVVIDGQERNLRMSVTERSGRTLTASNPADKSWTGSELVDYLKINRDVLSCLTNGRFFIEMDEAQQKDFLAGIVLPSGFALDPEIYNACRSPISIDVPADMGCLESIDYAYKQAYEKRTEVNRALKAWTAPEVTANSSLNIDDIRTRLADRQKQRTELAIQRTQMVTDYEKHQKAVERLAGRRQTLTDKLANAEQAKAQLLTLTLSDKALKAHQKIADHAAKAKELDEQIAVLKEKLNSNRTALDAFETLSECPKCPTCHQGLTVEAVEAVGLPLIKQRDILLTEQTKAWDARKALGDFDGAKRAIAAHEKAQRDLEVTNANIEQFKKELETIPEDASATPPDTSALDAQIADIDARIAKGNAALYEAGQQDERKKEYDRAMAQKNALDEKLALLEKLVEYFGPNGIKEKLLREHVGGFNAKMNAVMEKWGYYCELGFDPYNFTVQFRTADYGTGPCFSLRTLSKSQRYRFATAFQIALAQVTGMNFCVIDGADILDDAGRKALYGAIKASGLEQCVVMQTDARREVPRGPGRAFYLVSMELESGVPTSKVEKL